MNEPSPPEMRNNQEAIEALITAAQDASTALGMALIELRMARRQRSSLLKTAIQVVQENNVHLQDLLGKPEGGLKAG